MDDPRYKAARKYVRGVKDFYTHLAVFVIINTFLFALDAVSGSGWWFYWVVLGWGIGLAIHAYVAFIDNRFFGSTWEERKIAELLGEKPKRHGRLAEDLDDSPADYDDSLPLPDADADTHQRRTSR
ncbi:MAG TPA: 2TM domain-containing protein [Aggregatilineaceae bacterium]|nr:2TM domain-containing protein [Aggregatilineaceae bacterium]